MLEILIQGRGGQGAQTAGNQLAQAFFAGGQYVQCFASYGGARRGTPVSSFLRVDDKPIRRRCNIERPAAILCFDDSLLPALVSQFADPETLIVVNSRHSSGSFASLGSYKITAVDGVDLARRHGLGRFVNSALVGAFAGVIGRPSIDMLSRVIEETAPARKQENFIACGDAYQSALAAVHK